jgi:hypothetical protein
MAATYRSMPKWERFSYPSSPITQNMGMHMIYNRGISKLKAIDLAKELPTSNDPNPGPWVNAIADNCSFLMLAFQVPYHAGFNILLVC